MSPAGGVIRNLITFSGPGNVYPVRELLFCLVFLASFISLFCEHARVFDAYNDDGNPDMQWISGSCIRVQTAGSST